MTISCGALFFEPFLMSAILADPKRNGRKRLGRRRNSNGIVDEKVWCTNARRETDVKIGT
jgi:hypothetical protein